MYSAGTVPAGHGNRGVRIDVSQTFEELVGRELDGLYQGALFLCAGDRRGAEELLVDTLTAAFAEHAAAGELGDAEGWLDARLTRSYLSRAGQGVPSRRRRAAARPAPVPSAFDDMGAAELFTAAGALPPEPRAALWLVLFKRWSYDAAAQALTVDRDSLVELLRYRDALAGELVHASRSKIRGWGR